MIDVHLIDDGQIELVKNNGFGLCAMRVPHDPARPAPVARPSPHRQADTHRHTPKRMSGMISTENAVAWSL